MLRFPPVDYIEAPRPFDGRSSLAAALMGIEREIMQKTVMSKVVPCCSEAPSVFSGSSFSINLSDAFCHQMPQLVCHPIPERIIGDVALSVDEYGSAWKVSEHNAGVAGGHLEAVDSGVGDVFPMRHKNDAERKNIRAHDLHLMLNQSFFPWRGPLEVDLLCL